MFYYISFSSKTYLYNHILIEKFINKNNTHYLYYLQFIITKSFLLNKVKHIYLVPYLKGCVNYIF